MSKILSASEPIFTRDAGFDVIAANSVITRSITLYSRGNYRFEIVPSVFILNADGFNLLELYKDIINNSSFLVNINGNAYSLSDKFNLRVALRNEDASGNVYASGPVINPQSRETNIPVEVSYSNPPVITGLFSINFTLGVASLDVYTEMLVRGFFIMTAYE